MFFNYWHCRKGCLQRFSQVIIYWHISPVRFPPYTCPHFCNSVTFVTDMLSSLFINFLLFRSKLNSLFILSKSCTLTNAISIWTTPCFKQWVAVSNKHNGNETISLFLTSRFAKFLFFTFGSHSFKVRQGYLFELQKLFWRGCNRCIFVSNSYMVQGLVGNGWQKK